MRKISRPFVLIVCRIVLLSLIVLFAPNAPVLQTVHGAANTASFSTAGSGVISIVDIKDVAGASIPPPPGLNIHPFFVGPDHVVVEKSGSGALTFAGSAGIIGSGASTTVSAASDLSGTAVPAGVAEGIETTSGSIQFINNSGQAVEVTVRFDYTASASATVTDAALETVSRVFYDVEFQETLGGDPDSPCTGGILVDVEIPSFGAPPDTTAPTVANFLQRTVTIPAGSTCSYSSLVQTAGRAEAKAPPQPIASVPTLGTWAAGLLALILLLAGIRRVGVRRSA